MPVAVIEGARVSTSAMSYTAPFTLDEPLSSVRIRMQVYRGCPAAPVAAVAQNQARMLPTIARLPTGLPAFRAGSAVPAKFCTQLIPRYGAISRRSS